MLVNGKSYRAIWLSEHDPACVHIIDQRLLPHEFVVEDLHSVDDAIRAIADMQVRGAPLIGATAAWGLYLACLQQGASFKMSELKTAAQGLLESRPTAVNLAWAVERMIARIEKADDDKIAVAKAEASAICEEDVEICRMIGVHGLALIEEIAEQKNGNVINILTHCNAGWLATVDWGTATSPIYQAHQQGIKLHVWVDETRPRNQGASLTAWELGQMGVPHTVIVDNAGGHLMQQGKVDLVIVGTDRTASNGDVANKIGTYLKALAADDNDIPFYVALPSPTIDWALEDGGQIPIEHRDADEVKFIDGYSDGKQKRVLLTPAHSPALNPAFDVTPARLITGLITERGVCTASKIGLMTLFPEQVRII